MMALLVRRESGEYATFDPETLVLGFGATPEAALLDLAAEQREQYGRLCELGDTLSPGLRYIRDRLAGCMA